MDDIITIGYIIGGIIAIGIGYLIFISGLMLCLEIIKLLGDLIYCIIVFPFYLLFHPIKLFANTKEFFKEFYIKLPNLGDSLRTERALQKDEERRAKMTPEERQEEDDRRYRLSQKMKEEEEAIRTINIVAGRGDSPYWKW